MIVILGLILLILAVIVAVAAIVGNVGSAHELTQAFKVFGYHMTGSTGLLFLYGVIVGAVALLGLSMLLGGLRRTSRRKNAARRGLKESRRETSAARQDRDELIDRIDQQNTVGAHAAGSRRDVGTARDDRSPAREDAQAHRHHRHLFGRRPAHR
ncbi:hypothetical protein [Streptomyces sp. NPDC059398]|uniref:hypothetical protein n=1 Tax=Streptomyces sp. NPDC059398 TaxID=3346820 RepID=UPI0036BE98B7